MPAFPRGPSFPRFHTLSSTGSIGTTIFCVGGSILVLAATILMITKRRMGAND